MRFLPIQQQRETNAVRAFLGTACMLDQLEEACVTPHTARPKQEVCRSHQKSATQSPATRRASAVSRSCRIEMQRSPRLAL